MTGLERPAIRIEVDGRDVDDALGRLPAIYDGRGWESGRTSADYRYRVASVDGGGMTLRTAGIDGYIRGSIPPGGDYVVQWLTSGTGMLDVGREDIAVGPRALVLLPPDRPFVFDLRDYEQKLVHLDREVVRGLAEERGLLPPDSEARFESGARPAGAASELWFDTVGLVSRTVLRGQANDLLWSELTRLTAASFLQLFPVRAEPRDPAGTVASARVRAAVEYAHRFAASPIGPEDLAAAAGVSVRALQVAFQATLSQTPAAYIRQVRLERAHEELQRADPSVTTVAAVARAWGFVHLGRFAAQYQQRFGRSPRQTLQG